MLSVRGVSAWVEKRVRTYGAIDEELVRHELERLGVDEDRAESGISLALVRGRVVRRTGANMSTRLTPPMSWRYR